MRTAAVSEEIDSKAGDEGTLDATHNKCKSSTAGKDEAKEAEIEEVKNGKNITEEFEIKKNEEDDQ